MCQMDVRVDDIDIGTDVQHSIALINFLQQQQSQLKEETENDSSLNALKETIYSGWPATMRELPTELRAYWNFRDELAIENGIIFKGSRILIPPTMHKELLKHLHIGHQGIEKTRMLARETIYWPDMNKDIEKLCQNCTVCQEHMESNKREPIIPHQQPGKAWQFIASDLFDVEERKFILIFHPRQIFSLPSLTRIHNNTKQSAGNR